MTPKELKALRVKIRRQFNLSVIDACELVDLVAWGKMTPERLIEHLTTEAA